jgi:hypothetical protein
LRTGYSAGVNRIAWPPLGLMAPWAITKEAVNVTNGAANVIPRFHLGTYIFISFSGFVSQRTWRVAICECGVLIGQLNKENNSGHS